MDTLAPRSDYYLRTKPLQITRRVIDEVTPVVVAVRPTSVPFPPEGSANDFDANRFEIIGDTVDIAAHARAITKHTETDNIRVEGAEKLISGYDYSYFRR